MHMKKVIGVAAVVIAIMAVVLIAFPSTASAKAVDRTYNKVGGEITYNGKLPRDADAETNAITVYEGEEIYFRNESTNISSNVTVSGPYDHEGDKKSGCADYSVSAGKPWDSDGMKTGYFKVVEKKNTDIGCWFSVDKQSFSLELEDTKVREKESFNLSLKTNDKKGGVMKLTIEDDEGYSITSANGTDIYEVLVNYTEYRAFDSDPVDADGNLVDGIIHNAKGELVFDSKQLEMKEGTYTIILEDYATEVEETEDIEVEKWYLEMECSEEVIKGWEDIVITIQSSYYDKEVNVTVEGIPKWKEGKTLTLDEEGKKRIKIPTENVDYGRYKVTVKVVEFPACAETRYVLVKKGETTLEVPETATVGDIVHMKGTSDYGYLAVFVIDDVYKGDAAIVDDEFEWYWNTGGEIEGYYGIEVFILNDRPTEISIGDGVSKDWQREKGVDASASIILNYPAFSMTAPKSVAKGDPIVISGTAAGADHVYVIVFNYQGDVMFPYTGNMSVRKAEATPVVDGEWTETLSALDFGDYTVIALDEGRDGRTDAIKDDKWEIGGEGKTLEQRVAILMDAITSAGSDDLYEKAHFSVASPEVILEVPETVEIGTVIEVKAETNIKEGTEAFVSLSQDSRIINKTTVEVKSGSVTENIITSGLQPGRYNVAVDVSERAFDEKMVTLVEKKEVVEEGKEEIAQNESLTEHEPVEEANVSAGEINESYEGEERKMPVSLCDLLIAAIMAIFIAVVVKLKGRQA